MRQTLRQYLDDPSLLSQISIEEMEVWAAQVPYASLIHRLMVLKISAGVEDDVDVRSILRNVVVHTSDPSHILSPPEMVSDDTSVNDSSLHDTISAQETSHSLDITTEEEEIGLKKIDKKELRNADESDLEPIRVEERKEEEIITEPKTIVEQGYKEVENLLIEDDISSESLSEEETELSSFAVWLQSLQRIEIEEEGGEELELESEVASETLAEILHVQGYSNRAIEMYYQLQLKYPEKSSFFAAQIEKIKSS